MKIRIVNIENELIVHEVDGKNITYVPKSGLTVKAISGNVVITDGNKEFVNASPSDIILPVEEALYDLVQILHGYILDNVTSGFSGGWADYNDLATIETPITITGGAGNTVLTNDGLGANTNTTKIPFGVSRLWNPSTNKMDFSGLSIGDWIDIRIVISVIVATNNTQVNGLITLGSGGNAFSIPIIPTTNYKTTGTYSVPGYIGFYIGSEDVLINGGQLVLSSDTTCTVTVDGWAIKAIKIGN